MNKQSKNNEARYEGVNWDSEWKPKARMRSSGADAPQRKVLTKGVREQCCDLGAIKRLLRQGYEVRLREPGAKETFLRIFPVLGTDLKTMYAACKAMSPLSGCLADKKVRVVFRGKEYANPEDAAAAFEETRYHREDEGENSGEELAEVTPDTVVKCPKCGTRFRVGRALANNDAA